MTAPNLSTTRVAGQTGHIADSNKANTMLNRFDNATPTRTGQVPTWNGSLFVAATPSGTPLGWVSVASHGAIGDGVADDTAAIEAAILAAGARGTVFFPKTNANYRIVRSLKPLERQLWLGDHQPRYSWDSNVASAGGSIIRASGTFTGSAVIHNTTGTPNGMGQNTTSSGVIIRNLGILGNREDGAVDGIDFGPASGPERSWLIDRCQIMYTGTALCGNMWVTTVKDSHIARNGYGLSPHRGADATSRMLDSLIGDNYFYFNYHHAVDLGGSRESGLVILRNNRFERSGTSMDPMNPSVNRDATACGILISRATAVVIQGNTTDANAGPGLRIAAAAHGLVNNVSLVGNIWKRDGTGNNSTTMTPGVAIKDAMYVSIAGDIVTYGDPNDGGSGRIAPQYGIELSTNDWVQGQVSIQLADNALTRSNGLRWVGTANWMCSITDARQSVLQFPYATTSTLPQNPQCGSAYFDTTLSVLRIWTGSAWKSATMT
jgi:hypothetical protein